MPVGGGSFSRDLSSADPVDHELQEWKLGVGDANHQSAIFIGVQASQCDGALTIDKSRDVGRGIGFKLLGVPALGHNQS